MSWWSKLYKKKEKYGNKEKFKFAFVFLSTVFIAHQTMLHGPVVVKYRVYTDLSKVINEKNGLQFVLKIISLLNQVVKTTILSCFWCTDEGNIIYNCTTEVPLSSHTSFVNKLGFSDWTIFQQAISGREVHLLGKIHNIEHCLHT